MTKRKYELIDTSNLVSATRVSNYARNDKIIDYLDLIDKEGLKVQEDSLLLVNKGSGEIPDKLNENGGINYKKRKTSFDYIVEEGWNFEYKIIDYIYKMEINKEKIITIEKCKDIKEQYEKTLKILQSHNYEVILGAMLINLNNMTYGYPDMIVLGSWINKYIDQPPKNIIEDIYYIIDIKSSTINLINKGTNVCANNLFEGYKTQIWVYKEALNNIQKIQSNYGFILGKKYKYVDNNNVICINNPFYMLGVIDYVWEKTNGNDIKNKVTNAIKWLDKLKKNWKKYKLYPITKDLKPNMKNHYDKNYKKIKTIIAKKNEEITLLWNCGIKQRDYANKSRITKISDYRLTPEKLGFVPNSERYPIINQMLKMSRINKKSKLSQNESIESINNFNNLINLSKSNNFAQWQKNKNFEFFVDFETYINNFDSSVIYEDKELNGDINDIEEIELIDTSQCIYMMGTGHFDSIKNNYIFKCFIIKYVGSESIYNKLETKFNCSFDDIILVNNEKELLEKFIEYIYSFKNKNEPKYRYLNKVRLIHWSKAEPSLFSKKLSKYNINTINNILPWFDLLDVFKYKPSPIIIQDCYSFSLKEIVKTMNNKNMIEMKWPDLDDGLLSAFIARDIYKNNPNDFNNPNDPNNIVNNNNMQDIVEYNYIDCKALYLILKFIRSNVK
jgi:hypothetical protein